jgi:uncharacterized protein (DUF1501 family)
MLRRHLLQQLAAGAGGFAIGRHAWAAAPANLPVKGRLVVVFLRGAVDGLNVVVPYAEPGYQRARPTIALKPPGQEGGVLDLDGRFGLHPALAPLMPWWQSGALGFVHASGSHDPTRSHFDAQDHMETATPGRKTTPDGWMNRLLGVAPADAAQRAAAARAVSVGPVLPRIWAGPNAVANIASGAAATRAALVDRPAIGDAFAKLYAGDDRLSRAYQESQQARQDIRQAMARGDDEATAMSREMQAANNGAPLPNGFPDDAARLAQLMRRDPRVQFAFMAVGGWDTHANQGTATGQLANRLAPVGQGLDALARGLGPAFADTTVLVMSEFGRTVRQNGNGGTDHGHGNALWLLGGRVAGGKVHGEWPGLEDRALHEGRDLAVTTDFRRVIAEVCEKQLRVSDAALRNVLPVFDDAGRLGVLRG